MASHLLSTDLSTITFFLVGDFTDAQTTAFEGSIPLKVRNSGRVSVVRSTTSVLNEALMQATPAFVSLVTAPLVFSKNGAVVLLEQLSGDTLPDVVYADSATVQRPDFSPERLRCQDYLGELIMYKTAVLQGIGGYRSELGAAAPFDLALRATAAAAAVSHVSSAVYRTEPSHHDSSQWGVGEFDLYTRDVTRALTEHLQATGGGHVVSIGQNGVFDTRRDVHGTPLVSIVIPTRGTFDVSSGIAKCLVIDAVRSIIAMTDYENYEIVVVADAIADEKVLTELVALAGPRLRLVAWEKPFNFSEKMNFGVLHARGDYVLLLNDDVDVLTREWLESMLALAQRPNAGMAGAMLYYDDDTIQHGGHAYYKGSPTHIGLGLPKGTVGPNNGYLVEREVSGVTAACAMMPKKVFLEVGGFTALLPGNFNDVDLCLKVGWKGYDIYWTPHAELYHFESKSRDAHVHFYELDVIERRWGLRLDDPRFWPSHPAAAG